MNRFLFISAFLIPIVAFAQGGEPFMPTVIKGDNKLEHTRLPRTHLSVIMPQGFRISKNFFGFEKDEKAVLVLTGGEQTNYYEKITDPFFSRDSLEAWGAKVFYSKDLLVNDYPGKYVEFQTENRYMNRLVFGDSTFSIMLTGTTIADDKKSQEELRAILRTVIYDKSMKLDPFEGVIFSIDDTKSPFKFAKYGNETYYYALNGESLTGNPYVLIRAGVKGPIPGDTTESGNFNIMMKQLSAYGVGQVVIQQSHTERKNNCIRYEKQLSFDIDGIHRIIYQLLIRRSDELIYFQGVCGDNFESSLVEFKKFAETLEFKHEVQK